MIDLEKLEKKTISRDLKGKFAFIYGPPKVGKTSFVANMPKCCIFCFEPGVNALTDIYAQPILSWKEFKVALKQLEKPAVKEKFDFCAFDTIDIAYELCEQFICTQNGWSNISEGAWGKGYALLKKEFSAAFRKIAQLGYGLMFISHDAEKVLKDDTGKEYTMIIPAAPPRATDVVNKLVDFIIYIGKEYDNETGEEKRVMHLRGNESLIAGSRYQYVPDTIPLSYPVFIETLLKAIDAQAAATGTQVEDNRENFYQENKTPFDEVMAKAKQTWKNIMELSNGDPQKEEALFDSIQEIIVKNFGAAVQLSSVPEKQQDLLELTVSDMEDLYKSLKQ